MDSGEAATAHRVNLDARPCAGQGGLGDASLSSAARTAGQKGVGREDCLREVAQRLSAQETELRQVRETQRIDDHWQRLLSCVLPAAAKPFGKTKGDRDEADQLYYEERQELLKERAKHRGHRARRRQAHAAPEGMWTGCDWRIWLITTQLKGGARQRAARWRWMLVRELQEAWARGNFHRCYEVANLLTGRRRAARRRRYGHIPGV